MKRKLLLKMFPCHDPEKCSAEKVVAVSQTVYMDGREILNVDLFWHGKLQARYFADADKEEYATFVCAERASKEHQGWTGLKLENAVRVVQGKVVIPCYYYSGDEWVWDSKSDDKRACKVLGTHSLEYWEIGVNYRKYMRANERKQERINRLIRSIPSVPEAAVEWVGKELFQGHFLLVKKEKDRFTYSCTHCGANSWKKSGWKHNEMTECPKCRHKVKVNRMKQWVEKRDRVTIIQEMDSERWTERRFTALCTWDKTGKRVRLFAEICAVIKNGEQWGIVYYGQGSEVEEPRQVWWDRNTKSKRWGSSYLWPGNLKEVLPLTGLENRGMDILAERKERFDVNTFIITAGARPYMEYMIKGGFTRLAMEITHNYGAYWEPAEHFINIKARKATGALNLDGNRVNRLKQLNGGLNALKWLQYEKSMEDEGKRIRISQEALEWLDKKGVEREECEDILQELGSVDRMANYMKKQVVSPKKILITWRDYLRMAKNEGLDTSDDIIRFPKDLKARHDQLAAEEDKRKEEERLKGYGKLDAQIMERMPEAVRYYWDNDNYMMIPAGKCEELMIEGRTLHHCVGRDDYYMKKMAAGTSWILFLRKKEDLEKAYYTIEIDMKSDRIMQWYSEYDRKPDSDTIKKVLDEFSRDIKKRKNKIRIQMSAAVSA